MINTTPTKGDTMATVRGIDRPRGMPGRTSGRMPRVASVILYESAPVTGAEHVAEAMTNVQEFAARHADQPELASVIASL
ncbi:hypothetical protein [Streptomyces atratus]|uniref:hypothetical protein n=1 Tax=Streptomyces atratus TaxID=1893 RepID=UPI00224D5FD7|nr:hypothetical protein [Streptomyces atratus]MCX5338707.1 hypothetical protein [Streptomyces atratus]